MKKKLSTREEYYALSYVWADHVSNGPEDMAKEVPGLPLFGVPQDIEDAIIVVQNSEDNFYGLISIASSNGILIIKKVRSKSWIKYMRVPLRRLLLPLRKSGPGLPSVNRWHVLQ
jgi:hypothetical protein